MNILYIGAGFVGACSAAVSAHNGHNTLVHDIDETRVKAFSSGNKEKIEEVLYEKGLADLLIAHKDSIRFTTDYSELVSFLDTCDAIFLCLPTPEKEETGETDLSYYQRALNDLVAVLSNRNNGKQDKYIVLINKSTVPIDMVDMTQKVLDSAQVQNVGVVACPEFLVEGRAIEGSLHPDRVVIGASSEKDFAIMRTMYRSFYDAADIGYIEVNPKEAAAGKLLANFYLFNKLALTFDVIGRTAEAFDDITFESLRKIITSDKRINSWGFYDSLYAGGSCLIKDARSLAYQLQETGVKPHIIKEVYSANQRQLDTFLERATKDAGFDWKGRKISILGTSFKKDTNDTRNSASYAFVEYAKAHGVEQIMIYDPMGMPMFQKTYPASDMIQYVSHEYEAIKNTDLIVIATDWPQFRGLGDILIAEQASQKPLIMDGRRMLQHRYHDLQAAGFDIIAVGSKFISAIV